MTLEELKEIVRQLISQARVKSAFDKIIKWAQDNDQDELKNESSFLKGRLEKLNRNMRLGIISNADATQEQNKISLGVLGLLDNINEGSPNQNNQIVTPPSPSSKKLKILMLTSNPANTTKLNLDKEHSVITQKLQGKQELFNIILKKAVSGTEFKEFTQQEQPGVLHFSGHGEKGKYAGIVVQNDDKNEEALIPIGGLKALFKFFQKHFQIKVVLLNACHTQDQAAVISKYVDYVIGTNVAIGDKAASAFSSGFYFQLAEDNQMDITNAFDSGRTEAVMKGAEEDNFVIYHKGELIVV